MRDNQLTAQDVIEYVFYDSKLKKVHFANKTFISEPSLRSWLRGDTSPTFNILYRICKRAGYDLAEVITKLEKKKGK